MKKKLMQLVLLSVLTLIAIIIYIDPGASSDNYVDGMKIMSALKSYQSELSAQGKDVPESVSLSELIHLT